VKLESIERWHKTKLGNLFFALFELTVAYLFASLAIDSGSLWQYAVAILLFIGAIQNLVKAIRFSKHERARH
jgi:hypothetical protein